MRKESSTLQKCKRQIACFQPNTHGLLGDLEDLSHFRNQLLIAPAYEGKTSLDESHGLVEWQADALATALLMPLPQIKRSFYRLRAGRSNEQLVAEMAQIFQVSKQAMRIRLETRNLI